MVDDSGRLYLELGQATGRAINVTGVGCGTTAGMSLTAMNVQIPSGSHAWVTNTTVTCSGASSPAFKGKISVQYTTAGSGLTRTVTGDIMYPINGNSDSGSSAIWNESFAYYQRFDLSTGVASNLTDFPFAVSLDTISLVSAGKMNADCSDLRAVDPTLTSLLDYEIEACNTANTIVWVRAPLTNGTQNFTAYIFYGNPAATDTQNAAGVWRNGFYEVLHMADFNATHVRGSVTGTLYTKRASGQPSQTTGTRGPAQLFDGVNSGVYLGNFDISSQGSAFSVSAFLKTTSSTYIGIINKRTGTNTFLIGQKDNGGVKTFSTDWGAGPFARFSTSDLNSGAWVHVAQTHAGSGGIGKFFFNGAQEANGSVTYVTQSVSNGNCLGMFDCGSESWSGSMDEVRFSNVERTDDWMKAEATQTSSGGSEQSNGGGEGNPFASWQYSRQITANTGVSSNLTDFPAYIVLDTASLISAGKMNSSCKDVRVMNSTRTGVLAYEIEACNNASTVIWFKVPQTNGTQDYSAYILYGNSAAADAQNVAGVWSNGYRSVFHLTDNTDSVAGATCSGLTFSQAAGKFGSGRSAGACALGYSPPAYPFGISAWVQYSSSAGRMGVGGAYQSSPDYRGGMLEAHRTTNAFTWDWSGGTQVALTSTADKQLNTWYYVAGIANAAMNHSMLINTNEAYGDYVTNGGSLTESDPLCLAGWTVNGGACSGAAWVGYLDEYRVHNVTRSTDWFAAEAGQTYTVGSEQPNS